MTLPVSRSIGQHNLQLQATAAAAHVPGEVKAAYGTYAGIVLGTQNIASGDSYVMALDGMWEIKCPSATTASAGDAAFLNLSDQDVVTSSGAGVIYIGRFAKAKVDGETVATIHLNADVLSSS